MSSFEAAKSAIVGSALGKALGLTASSAWASVVNAVKGVANRAGSNTAATSSLDTGNKRVRLQIPANGYYNTEAYLYDTYANIASLIGLTAPKIASGNTILGIAGTAKMSAQTLWIKGSTSVSFTAPADAFFLTVGGHICRSTANPPLSITGTTSNTKLGETSAHTPGVTYGCGYAFFYKCTARKGTAVTVSIPSQYPDAGEVMGAGVVY